MAHIVKILDNFIKDSKTSTIPQWIVFSAVRCLYENNIDHYAEIATSEAPLRKINTIFDFRNFALYKQGFNTNVIYNYEKIPITLALWNLLLQYKEKIVDTIPIKQYESYIILNMYPQLLLKENVKFIIIEYVNFTCLIDFLDLLNLMQHNKFSINHIKRLFKTILYDELNQELLGKKYDYNIEISNQVYSLHTTLNKASVEAIINSLINTKENTSIILSNGLNLDSSIKLQIESYIKTLKLRYQDDLIDKIVNYESSLIQIPTMDQMIDLNIELYSASEKTSKKNDVLNKLAETLIPAEVMTLPKLIRNTELLILLKIMEPNVKKLTFYLDLMTILKNQNVTQTKSRELSNLISNKRKINKDDDNSDEDICLF